YPPELSATRGIPYIWVLRGVLLRRGRRERGLPHGQRDLPDGDPRDGDRVLLRDRHRARRDLGRSCSGGSWNRVGSSGCGGWSHPKDRGKTSPPLWPPAPNVYVSFDHALRPDPLQPGISPAER